MDGVSGFKGASGDSFSDKYQVWEKKMSKEPKHGLKIRENKGLKAL